VTLIADTANIVVTDTAAAHDISAGPLGFVVKSNDALLQLASGAAISSTAGTTVWADKLDLQGTVTTASSMDIRPHQAGEAIDLGAVGDSTADALEISDAEVDRISARSIELGGADHRRKPDVPRRHRVCHHVRRWRSEPGGVRLHTTHGGNRECHWELENGDRGNSVDVLAASVTPGDFVFENNGEIAVDEVVGIARVIGLTINGDVGLGTHSPLTINQPVRSLGGGNVRLSAGESAEENGDLVIAAPVATSGGDGNIELSAGDMLVVEDQPGDDLSVSGTGSITLTAENAVQIDAGISLSTEIGEVQVNSSPVSLNGGSGDDLLIGKEGRDFLGGGRGVDRFVGNAGDDVLIADELIWETAGAAELEAALSAITAEWNRLDRSYEQRIENLCGHEDLGEMDRLNGSYFLKLGVTIIHDESADKLTGSSGMDWFFFDDELDRATDLKDEVFADELDWILS
jgi:Ca2+-binding RTX toxin-like protein